MSIIYTKTFRYLNTFKLTIFGFREFNSSSIFSSKKFEKTPYPWKNFKFQDPKYQYANKIQDSDLTDENKEALLDKRSELALALNEERQQILKTQEWPRNEYKLHDTQRCGLIGYKLGCIPHWTKTGKRLSVTLYQVMDNVALNYIPPNEVEGLFRHQRFYMKFASDFPSWVTQRRWGLQFVGAISADPSEFTAQYAGLYTKYGIIPRRKLARFLVSEDAALEPGTELSVQHFRIGDRIDVTARTTNSGFQGVMIRHGFKGGKDYHGATKMHRRGGAISHGVKPIRGTKMPGVKGNRMVTHRGKQIIRMDYKHNILYLSGVTAGPIHSYAHLCDTWLRFRKDQISKVPSMPTIYENDEEWIDWTQKEDDDFLDTIHKFDDPTILYENS